MTIHIITDKDCGEVVTIHPSSDAECFAGFSHGVLYIDKDCAEMLDDRVVDVLGCYENDPYVHLMIGTVGR